MCFSRLVALNENLRPKLVMREQWNILEQLLCSSLKVAVSMSRLVVKQWNTVFAVFIYINIFITIKFTFNIKSKIMFQ